MNRFAEVVFNLPLSRSFYYTLPEGSTAAFGCRVVAPFGRRKLTGCIVGITDDKPSGIGQFKDLERVLDKEPVFDGELLDLATWIADVYLCSLGEALNTMLPGGRTAKETADGVLDDEPRQVDLSAEQSRAAEAIINACAAQDVSKPFYLYGVTGSGKTEVFHTVSRFLLTQGKSIIYLVPEISLVPQIVERFAVEFKGLIAELHSGLTPSQKLKEWRRIQGLCPALVIGARSAVFAPVRKLGLIIMDEEHETSYKSGFAPRYHARQIAAVRAARAQAVFVMASATPSVDAYYRMEQGQIAKLVLSERHHGGDLPRLEIVDMKREKSVLSLPLQQAIRDTVREKRQIILFLNRRGFSHYFFCRSCGYEMKCVNCSVALTYHKNKQSMKCHYCGYGCLPLTKCPECRSLDIGYNGFGTERIEEEVSNVFPDLKMCRLDSDTVRNKERLAQTIRAFRNREIDLLLGTQMVAKGLNFPGVKLVGIISIDFGLQLPDFRALERSFSLITQVAGRAGRALPDGRVLIQTYKPDNPVIRMAAQRQFERFYTQEISDRKLLGFPPFVRLIRIVMRGKNQQKVHNTLSSLCTLIRSHPTKEFSLLGPVECPLAVLAGNFRFHILLKAADFSRLHRAVKESLAEFSCPTAVFLEIDIDPIILM